MTLSDERYDALLSGEPPLNEDEAIWLKNYKEKQHQEYLKMQAREHQYRNNKEKAYHEFYNLIKSTFPKDAFIKKPLTNAEYDALYNESSIIADKKVKAIQKSRLLQIRYGIFEVPRSDVEAQVYNSLYRDLINITICKKLGYSYFLLWNKYNKLFNKDFNSKISILEQKYNVHIHKMFDIEYWCTDYVEYRDYKA